MKCFASMDWGYNAPGCVLWWLCLLDGHYHIWREYKFQQTPVWEVGQEIKKRTKALGLKLDYVTADPAMWQHTGAGRGEAIAETLQRAGLPMRKGDNDRKNGWQRVHELLRLAPDGHPWLTVEDAPQCTYLRRTIAAAMSDKVDPDDVDTKGDDHALDALRYGAMSRPPIGRSIVQAAANKEWTLAWLKNQSQRPAGILAGRTRVA
jgi:hypothetical protein